jgi:hypothetical protein
MRQGGLALFGWSFGTSVVLDVLATADQIPAATRESLKPYLRCVGSIGARLLFMHYLHIFGSSTVILLYAPFSYIYTPFIQRSRAAY